MAIKAESESLQLGFIIMGTLAGMFFLDLDYLIHVFFLEPDAEFSKTVTGFIKHKDFYNAFNYIHYHSDEVKDKTLNSALFQVVLTALMLYVSSSNTSFFLKALVYSSFLNSMYRFSEYYFQNKVEEWFWMLKSTPSKNTLVVYTIVLLGIFVYCISIF
jgi:hypothetical protein